MSRSICSLNRLHPVAFGVTHNSSLSLLMLFLAKGSNHTPGMWSSDRAFNNSSPFWLFFRLTFSKLIQSNRERSFFPISKYFFMFSSSLQTFPWHVRGQFASLFVWSVDPHLLQVMRRPARSTSYSDSLLFLMHWIFLHKHKTLTHYERVYTHTGTGPWPGIKF